MTDKLYNQNYQLCIQKGPGVVDLMEVSRLSQEGNPVNNNQLIHFV